MFPSCAEFKTAALEKLTQNLEKWGFQVLEKKLFEFLFD